MKDNLDWGRRGEAMSRRNVNREELEQKLRSYFRAEAEESQPSPQWWEKALSNLGDQKPARRWSFLPGPFTAIQPLRVFGATAVAAVLVGVVSLLIFAPWQGAPAATSTSTSAPRPSAGPQGPAGAPGTTLSSTFQSEDRDVLVTLTTSGEVLERMIVYQGDLTLAVKEDLGKAMDNVAQIAVERDGFVVSSSRQGDESATITVRVPSEKFGETKQAVRSLGVRVLSESTRSQDVTEEYVDLQARLRNWEAAESQYLELIKKAATVDETLKVQERLVSVREEIERIKGRMQYLERTSSMASVTVQLKPASNPEPLVRTDWNSAETGRSALRSLAEFGQRLAGVAIWVGVYSPVWIVLGVVLFLLGRRLTRS
ncbi:MAG: DUF4349 domain-containing protein [Chloroflexota bacterium]|nr:DUF4349 domain-containing protein [Chloroflexota bacterium]